MNNPTTGPARPGPTRPGTPSNVGYALAGTITSDQAIHGNAADYAWLDEQVLEVVKYVQQSMVAANRADDIDHARRDPKARAGMSQEIDRLALQYLMQKRGITGEQRAMLIGSVVNEILGLGPLEPLWTDPSITEVIANGPNDIYVERDGVLTRATGIRFRNQEHLLDVCQRILAPLNRKVDVRDPLADGRLPDGSRVNIVHTSLAPRGPLLTIRRFPENTRSMVDLVDIGSMDEGMATLLATLVDARASLLVVGGTGSGKALDVDTPIPTPDGFVRMGDLQVGDVVLGSDGAPVTVTGAYDVMENHDCFEVEISDGSTIVADAEHLWNVQIDAADTTVEVTVDTRQIVEHLHGQETFGQPTLHLWLPNRALAANLPQAPVTAFTYRSITAARPVPSRPVRCIAVNAADRLFLAGETYIPTHNTTLLNALSVAIPKSERLVTIEDSLELRLHSGAHVAAMEARPPDSSGKNAVTIRQLVKNALRMRPDRIIVGEIRDAAALDMLQACNTGHEGSMSTVHANGPNEAISRLSVMVAQGGEIPAHKVDWLVGSALDVIVMARRYEDGSRRVSGIYEVPDMATLEAGESLITVPLWEWEQTGVDEDGRLLGKYVQRNEASEGLRRAKGLDLNDPISWSRLREMCGAPPADTSEDATEDKETLS